ncbi:MAG: bifunctional pyr operon transcriptional regulator/uracil phosphoribosyltransferase PyrR [Firmicutes bacterium]|nr:bifunctional pyr operon transcriptional regulator/uracil phosphoribosyltransferase PyrR [Bacillota bacterium]
MKLRSNLMSKDDMNRALKRISHQILEQNQGADNLVLLGIMRRGVPLAKTLAANIKSIEGIDVPVGEIDITMHRDDLNHRQSEPIVNSSKIPCDIENKIVILVDDVLYTGRTVRAALDATSEYGRASKIQLAVLIDRGHRELPIRADYVGKNVPTSKSELVKVHVLDIDGVDDVQLFGE